MGLDDVRMVGKGVVCYELVAMAQGNEEQQGRNHVSQQYRYRPLFLRLT
jgi:hypothetical protein